MPKLSQPATKIDIINLRQDNKNLYKRFDHLEEKLFRWKSEIHNLVDKGFSTKAKKLDEEVDILNGRTVNLRQRTEKLEKTVFGIIA